MNEPWLECRRALSCLGLALAIGLLVGLERGWREREAPAGSRTAGIRTYGISGLLGGAAMALAAASQNSLILPAGFLGFTAVFAWFKWHEQEHDEDFSATSVIAAIAVLHGIGLVSTKFTWISGRSQ